MATSAEEENQVSPEKDDRQDNVKAEESVLNTADAADKPSSEQTTSIRNNFSDASNGEATKQAEIEGREKAKLKRRPIALSLLLHAEEVKQSRIPSLVDLCVDSMAQNFSVIKNVKDFPKRFREKIVGLLPEEMNIPIEMAVDLIDDENYWKRCSLHKYKNCQVVEHGSSWKQLFCEKYLKEVLEDFDPSVTDIEELIKLLDSVRVKIRSLSLTQLPSHMDLAIIFNHLNLSSLSITYDMRNVGMNYERSLFGMKMADCSSLSRCLTSLDSLTYLNLSRNLLDDEKLRMIVSGLAENTSITHLDVSHNKIADRGVRALARLLSDKCVIRKLSLADNQIHGGGGKALGRALKKNESLEHLSVRLNRLGDEGAFHVFDGIKTNSTLRSLNISANALEIEAARAIALMAKTNTTLTELDISCNALRVEGGKLIRDGMEENSTIRSMDLRLNEIGAETEAALVEILKKNELQFRNAAKETADDASVKS